MNLYAITGRWIEDGVYIVAAESEDEALKLSEAGREMSACLLSVELDKTQKAQVVWPDPI